MALGYMLPGFTSDYRLDHGLNSVKQFCNLVLGFFACVIKAAHLSHLFFGKPSVEVFTPYRMMTMVASVIPASFRNHISSIIRASANKEMGGVTTKSIVATVADKHPIWNLSVCEHIRGAVSRYSSPLIPVLPIMPTLSFEMRFPANPFPANIRVSLAHIRPKALFVCLAFIFMAMSLYITIWLAFNETIFCVVLLAYIGLLTTTAVTITIWNYHDFYAPCDTLYHHEYTSARGVV